MPLDGYDDRALARLDAAEADRELAWMEQADAEAQAAQARRAAMPDDLTATLDELRRIAFAHLAYLASVPLPRRVATPHSTAGVVLAPEPYTGEPEPLPLQALMPRERMTTEVVVRQRQDHATRCADEALRSLTGRP